VYDIKFHIRHYKTIYFMFFLCLIIGVVCGLVIIFSSESYLALLTSKNKSLYPYINGTANYVANFWKQFLFFIGPLVLIFMLNMNYYTGVLSYLFITYQSGLLALSCAAIIKTYGVSGVFNVLLVVLPINILYLCIMVFFSVTCLVRSRQAFLGRNFAYGFNRVFYSKIIWSFIAVLVLSVVVCFVYPLFLKSSIFIIF